MKRNKRTETVWLTGLCPLTERILTKMGSQGAEIRQRLQVFYQTRLELGNEVIPEGFAERGANQV
jgi:hypothetical protein